MLVINGRKISMRKNWKPFTRLELRMTASTSAPNSMIGTYKKNRMIPLIIDCQNTWSPSSRT